MLAAAFVAGCGGAEAEPTETSAGSIVAATRVGPVLMIEPDRSNAREVANLGSTPVLAVAVAPGSPLAYVATDRGCDSRIIAVSLDDGAVTDLVAPATSVAVTADGRLAYVELQRVEDICYRKAIVVRDLESGVERRFPFAERSLPVGTPPELVMNFSPDGRRLAFVGKRSIQILDVEAESDASSAPVVPGSAGEAAPSETPPLAPAFLDADTLLAYAGCCIGGGELVSVDLDSGDKKVLTAIEAPIRSIRVLPSGEVVLVTELQHLEIWDGDSVRTALDGVAAAG